MKKLKSVGGDIAVGEAVKFIWALFLAFLLMGFLSVAYRQVKLEICASELVRQIEIAGTTQNFDDIAKARLEKMGFDVSDDSKYTADVVAIYFNSSEKTIQYNNEFSVELSYIIHIRIGGGLLKMEAFDYPITLKAKATGRSEQYWK